MTRLVTGLDTNEAEAVEPIQVVSYGIGGHYEPHVDYMSSENDRMATMLYYLSPEAHPGGATVFPFLGLAVRPDPGGGLFWYNRRRQADQGEFLTLRKKIFFTAATPTGCVICFRTSNYA